MTPQLTDRVISRLTTTGAADQPWTFALLAAMDGRSALESYLDDGVKVRTPAAATAGNEVTTEPPGVYLASITVEGFRGVGPATTLKFRPGPGLTLVVGRNGSGKSSFAEGIEYLLTGRNYRWEKRPKVWEGGWRNLHQNAAVSLKADLVVEGEGTLTVTRSWKTPELAAAPAFVKRGSGSPVPLEKLGWNDALVAFRPFLSYNELGSLLDEGPSKLYDALSGVLGLEELAGVQDVLASARKERQRRIEDAKEGAQQIRDAVAALSARGPDERFDKIERSLKKRDWDITALEALVGSGVADPRSDLALLQRLMTIAVLDETSAAQMVERLRAAQKACAGFAGTNAERSQERARLLEQALKYHQKHTGGQCPVCGTDDALDEAWPDATRNEIEHLKTEATACVSADNERQMRIREAQKFLAPPPPFLAEASVLGLSALADTRRSWTAMSAGRDLTDATALAEHLERHAAPLAAAQQALIAEAEAEFRRREDVWAPIATALAEWLPKARLARRAAATVDDLKAAEAWWKETTAALRDERFAPVAGRAIDIWKRLRLQSNVDLGSIDLAGTAQRRRVALSVTVDGTPAEALGVMSQGELHGLALSLFLPRATLAESPFRFLSIDDPVQSMDPARVEGLARVLADVARARQVIVFTHDDRLPEAVRRLGIPATVFEVARRSSSVVSVRPRPTSRREWYPVSVVLHSKPPAWRWCGGSVSAGAIRMTTSRRCCR